MRPIKLLVEGFTCFRSKVELDFSGTDLFVITGPTGSGKTSLIDAVIFSLYGCTPRCGERAISDLISLGISRLATFLEFASGPSTYRISRTIRRTKTGINSQRRLERLDGGEWKGIGDKDKEVRARIQKIIGLDFEGFTRSVVLPQGEFDRFLKGDPGERRKILTALLRLEKYGRMSSLAYRMATDCLARASTIETILEQKYADAGREREKELKKQIKELAKSEESVSATLQGWKKLDPVAREIRRLRQERSKLDHDLKEAEARSRSGDKVKKAAEKSLQEVNDQLKDVQEKLADTGYNEGLHLQLSAAAPMVKRLAELETEAQGHISTESSQRKRLKETEEHVLRAGNRMTELRHHRESTEKSLREVEAELTDSSGVHGTFGAVEGLLRRLRSSQVQRDRHAALQKELEELAGEERRATREFETAERELARAREALNSVEKELESLRQRHAAMDLRSHLREGDPCPVCEQIVHNVPGSTEHEAITQAEKRRGRFKLERDSAQRRVVEGENSRKELPKRRSLIEDNLRAIEDQLVDLDEDLQRCLGGTPPVNPEAELESLVVRLKALEKQVEEGRRKLEKVRAEERDAAAESNRWEQERSLIQFALDSLARSVERNRNDVKQLKEDLSDWPDPKTLPDLLKKQEEALESRRSLDRQKQKLDGDLTAARDRLNRAEREWALSDSEVTRTRNHLGEVTSSLQEAEKQLLQLKPDLQKTLVEDEAARVEAEIRKLEVELREISVETARTGEKLETLTRRIAEAAQLQKELKSLKGQAALAGQLRHLLRGDQLVAFILQEVFSRLAAQGTEHLRRLSSERYSFAVSESNFSVIDHWNADEQRSVTTLSGGESFLASLALALALSESLDLFFGGGGPVRLDSLFLDEGFSTLDAETLDQVVQGIETLAVEERMIGVISHIPELAERFPHRIEVEKSIGGSRVRVL